jgi:hypothetical protein
MPIHVALLHVVLQVRPASPPKSFVASRAFALGVLLSFACESLLQRAQRVPAAVPSVGDHRAEFTEAPECVEVQAAVVFHCDAQRGVLAEGGDAMLAGISQGPQR